MEVLAKLKIILGTHLTAVVDTINNNNKTRKKSYCSFFVCSTYRNRNLRLIK